MVEIVRAGLNLFIVGPSSLRSLLYVMSKVHVILRSSCVLRSQEVWANGSVPAGSSLLLYMLDPVRTVCRILFLGEAGSRRVNLAFEAIGIRFDFLDVGSKVGLIVGVQVGCCVGTSLQVWSANAG